MQVISSRRNDTANEPTRRPAEVHANIDNVQSNAVATAANSPICKPFMVCQNIGETAGRGKECCYPFNSRASLAKSSWIWYE